MPTKSPADRVRDARNSKRPIGAPLPDAKPVAPGDAGRAKREPIATPAERIRAARGDPSGPAAPGPAAAGRLADVNPPVVASLERIELKLEELWARLDKMADAMDGQIGRLVNAMTEAMEHDNARSTAAGGAPDPADPPRDPPTHM